jgi:hypothetical protein
LNDYIYSKYIPENYYRYLKEFQNEDENKKNEIMVLKLRDILSYYFLKLDFYRKLLLEK